MSDGQGAGTPPQQQGAETVAVAVDDTESSDRAFAFTVRHMLKPGTELHLVHVVPRQGNTPQAFYDEMLTNTEKMVMDRFLSKLPEGFKPKPIVHIIQSEMDTDSVGHILVKKAQQLNAVALVMSSHNKGRIANFFLGSVTKFVTCNARTPVVVVPQPPA